MSAWFLFKFNLLHGNSDSLFFFCLHIHLLSSFLATMSGIHNISSSSSSSGSEALAAEPVAVARGTSPVSVGEEHFKWVRLEVLSYSSILSREEVFNLTESGFWVNEVDVSKYVMARCSFGERVCHCAREGEGDFVYMYESVFLYLGVTLPFDSCTANVLRTLGIAPSQLHPNGWAALQAFRMLCKGIGVVPSARVFLSSYTVRVGKTMGWVSLSPLPNSSLFNTYTVSHKGFKDRFVKIQAIDGASFCLDSQPIPLY